MDHWSSFIDLYVRYFWNALNKEPESDVLKGEWMQGNAISGGIR